MSKEAQVEDVKQTATTTSVEASTVPQEVVNQTEENYETAQKDIPYPVFQKKNAKLRETEKKLKDYEKNMERKVQEEVYRKEMELRREYEAKIMAKPKDDDFTYDEPQKLDDAKALKEEIESLRKQVTEVSTITEQDRINKTIDELKYEFPELGKEHVLAIKRARPDWNWDECAEYSHNYFKAELDKRWKGMVESKKQAATKKISGAEGIRSMKPEERPKSFKELQKFMVKNMGD